MSIPVLVADPVALLVGARVQEIEVVHQILKCLLFELVQVDLGQSFEVEQGHDCHFLVHQRVLQIGECYC